MKKSVQKQAPKEMKTMPQAVPPISRKELYEMLRKQIEHEDSLVNQRLNWLLASQAFLFTAFFSVIKDRPNAMMAGYIPIVIAIAGALVSIFSLLGIQSARASLQNLRETWYYPYTSEEERQQLREGFPQITWVGKGWQAINTARGFPWLVISIWIIMIITFLMK